jgi:hypothetical protein
MRKFTLALTILMLIVLTGFGQAPQAFKYQAVVRDTSGSVLSNKLVSMKVSILEGSIDGQVVFSELHDVLTNSLGLINLEIGRGFVTGGDFALISWGEYSHFIRLEMDPDGAMNYRILGTSELLSVPYALYAEKSGTGGGSDTTIYVHNDTTIYTGDTKWKDSPNGIYYDEGYVGIGTSMPESKLHLEGTSTSNSNRKYLWLKNNSTDNLSCVYLTLNSGGNDVSTYLSHHSSTYNLVGGKYAGTTLLWNDGRGLFLRTRLNGIFVFESYNTNPYNDPVELVRITGDGKVGIGTQDPKRLLHVNAVMRLEPLEAPPENPGEGDIYMDGNDHKLKVFDGTSWQSCW